MAGGTIAELNVAINAVDNASGVIAGIAAELGGLSGTAASAASGVGNVNGVLNDTARAGRTANAAYTAAARGGNMLVRTSEDLQRSGVIIKQYGEGVDTLIKPLQTAAVVALGLGTASTVAAVKFEDDFANVKKTVEGTPEQLEAVRKGIIDMTTVGINGHGAIPQTTAQLTELAAAGGQLGIQTENILDFTETMAMLGSATNLQGETGAQTLARFMNVANVSQKDIGRLGSAIVDLGNNFATTEAEIANMAMDMGATGATVGMSAQDILGYATAMSSMGIEAAAGGSALQRIWMDMQNSVSKGGDRLEAFAKVSGKSSKEFQKQWKEDATGAFNDFLKGLNNSPDQVGLLNALDFNNVRDQRALLALAGEKGFDILTEAIKRSNKAWEENTALQTEFENKQQTTASQIQIAKNNAVEAARSFGEVLLPTVVDVTGGIAQFAQDLANLDDSGKKAIITGAKGVVIAGALAKGTVGVIKGIGNTADALGKIKKAAEAGGVFANIAKATPKIASAAESVGALGAVAGTSAGIAAAATAPFALYYGGLKLIQNQFEKTKNETISFGESTEKLTEDITAVPEKTQKAVEQIDKFNKVNDEMLSKKDKADALTGGIEKMAQAYRDIVSVRGNNKGEEIRKLWQENADLVQKYKEIIGSDLTAESLLDGSALQNIKKQTEEWGDSIKNNAADIDKAKKGLENVSKLTQQQALESEGYTSIFDAFQDGEQGVQNVLTSMKQWGEKFNLPMEYSLKQMALFKNGFSDLQEVLDSADTNAINAVFNDFAKLGKAEGFDNNKIIEFAKAFNMIPEGKHIEFTVDGDISLVDNIKEVVAEIDGKKCTVTVDANGNVSMLDEAGNKVAELQNTGAVSIMVEADGSVALLDEAGQKVGDLSNNGNVTVSVNANGDVTVLDEAGKKLEELKGLGAANIQVNAEGNFEVLNEAGEKVAELDGKTGKITVLVEKQDPEGALSDTVTEQLPDKTVTQNVTVKKNVKNENGDSVKDGKSWLDSIHDWLFPSAAAEELDGGEATTVTQEITQTVNVTAIAGSVDTSAFVDTMSAAMELVGAANESSITRTVNITAVPGSVDTSALSGAVEGAVSGLSSASVTTDIAVNGTANFALGTSPTSVPPATGVANFVLGSYPTEIPPITATVNVVYSHKAQGTQYFGGGLAMVNDELGRADKRELIIDQGRAFIPQGENVVLPLSKGAKVYTATQTQRILKSLGIAQYAGGKDNDDILGTLQSLGLNGIKVQKAMPDNVRTNAEWLYEWKNGGSMAGAPNSKDFELAKEKFEHEKKTRAMSTTEELQKWIEFSKQFNETEKDIAVIEEQIFSLTSKISDELNKQSAAWIEDRVALNDWQGYGDSAIAAFDRVKERNYKDFQDGLMTWQEYTDTISDLGSDMYSGRIKQSEQWLEHEERYNDMSTDGYLAGIDRMKAYTEEYYAKGLINHREYVEGKIELDEMEADKKREQYEEWKTDADAWETMRDTYGDWGDVGDDKEDFLIRKIARAQEAFAAGKSDLKTYIADMNQYKMDVFKYREEMYDDFLSQRKDYISDLKDEFAAAEKELQDSWTVEDRKADMSEVSEQLYIYSDAVTDRGQQKYKELQEQMKQLQRDEELYQLQVANNETIEALEEEYKQLEADKSVFLKGIKDNFDIDVSGLLSGFEQSNNTINRTLGDIINAINNIKMEQTIYSDSRKIQNNISHVTGELYDEIIVSVSGR